MHLVALMNSPIRITAILGARRGDFSASQQKNLVHASDGPEAAKREIEFFFGGEE